MTSYRIAIAMDAETVSELSRLGFLLNAAQEVPDVAPVIWLTTGAYAQSTVVQRDVQYEVCADGSCVPVDLGQIVVIGVDGLSVSDGGSAGAITVCNDSFAIRTFTVSVIVNGVGCGELGPYTNVAQSKAVITPPQTVLLAFATEPVDTGTVITRASGPVLRVDLTGAPDNTRSVGYAVGFGWTWDGGTWAAVVMPVMQ